MEDPHANARQNGERAVWMRTFVIVIGRRDGQLGSRVRCGHPMRGFGMAHVIERAGDVAHEGPDRAHREGE
jgi:hypothetical protein